MSACTANKIVNYWQMNNSLAVKQLVLHRLWTTHVSSADCPDRLDFSFRGLRASCELQSGGLTAVQGLKRRANHLICCMFTDLLCRADENRHQTP